jgi:hypothetical protein
VFHQPIFSSGNATISNDQMRTIGGFLQDYGVNLVFNGHEHNFQRTLPIRALSNVTSAPVPGVPRWRSMSASTASPGWFPTVCSTSLKAPEETTDFDDDLPNPRGGGSSIDQDDAASGPKTQTVAGVSYDFKQGAAAFLDTSLSDDALTLYQISEPLGTT